MVQVLFTKNVVKIRTFSKIAVSWKLDKLKNAKMSRIPIFSAILTRANYETEMRSGHGAIYGQT